jgi:hypothetical protein
MLIVCGFRENPVDFDVTCRKPERDFPIEVARKPVGGIP